MGWREKILGDESLNFEISDGLVRGKNSMMVGSTNDGEDRGMEKENFGDERLNFEISDGLVREKNILS